MVAEFVDATHDAAWLTAEKKGSFVFTSGTSENVAKAEANRPCCRNSIGDSMLLGTSLHARGPLFDKGNLSDELAAVM